MFITMSVILAVLRQHFLFTQILIALLAKLAFQLCQDVHNVSRQESRLLLRLVSAVQLDFCSQIILVSQVLVLMTNTRALFRLQFNQVAPI